MDYIITRVEDSDELMHYGVLGMKWGVRRYRNRDGSLTREGVIRSNRAFETEKSVKLNPESKKTEARRKVVAKYDKYKSDEQRKADDRANKAYDTYFEYVDNYRKSNKDVQTRYEHDYDHTKRGKKLLKEVYNSREAQRMAYIGEEWFWKYARDLVKAEDKDYMNNRQRRS